MYTWASCSGESRNRPTCLQTAGFELPDCTTIKLKRPKVTGGEVGVSQPFSAKWSRTVSSLNTLAVIRDESSSGQSSSSCKPLHTTNECLRRHVRTMSRCTALQVIKQIQAFPVLLGLSCGSVMDQRSPLQCS